MSGRRAGLPALVIVLLPGCFCAEVPLEGERAARFAADLDAYVRGSAAAVPGEGPDHEVLGAALREIARRHAEATRGRTR